ncbi:MAG: NUDIX domain-containing protein [Nanoarchaeota archaeon]|nr:NUDIX domain-containing protein [Nanoarchaeota archaeon]
MKHMTLCFVFKPEEKKILLGYKKIGFGKGKFNGFGGRVEENETIEDAAVRELFEESGIKTTTKDIRKVAENTFLFPHVPEEKGWNQIVHVFFADSWEGEPRESNEMIPEWVDIDKIPFDRMWQDDIHWLPLVLKNNRVKGRFSFNEDNESIHEMSLDELK